MFHSKMAGRPSLPVWMAALFLFAVGASAPAHAANYRPTVSGTAPSWVYVGSPYYFKAIGRDPEGATLRYSIANKPAWATFNTTSGVLSGTPTAVGLWTGVSIRVSDGVNTSAPLWFSIRASQRNNTAPVISGSPALSAVVGSTYTFLPTASDAERDPLRFTIANRPAWATFNTYNGSLTGTPTAAHIGTYSNIVITATDGTAKVSLRAFSITVSSSVNRAPTISGTPPASVIVGDSYAFRPVAADADNNVLGFSIQNRPAWATFNTATGQLSGTPTAASVGTYSNIVIRVSDGSASAALPAFSITVDDASIGAASLSWIPPTENVDGSALTDLAGYRIVYGASATQLTQTIDVTNAGISYYVITDLAPGTYYFAVRAYTQRGAESTDSNVVTKVVR
jgi:hypothetical protein